MHRKEEKAEIIIEYLCSMLSVNWIKKKIIVKIILPFFHDEFKLVHVGRPGEVVGLSAGAVRDFVPVAISNSEALKIREKGWVDEADLREELTRSR